MCPYIKLIAVGFIVFGFGMMLSSFQTRYSNRKSGYY